MDRREFIKLCSVAGLGVASTGLPGTYRTAEAADEGYMWIFVHAGGGWDPTMICDPKGNAPNSEGSVINQGFGVGDFLQQGNIVFAPDTDGQGVLTPGGPREQFLNRFWQQLTVINGIDCETNGHDSGTRNTWAGRMTEGTAAFGALLAGSLAGEMPMGFITNGGYDVTDGVVAPTRLGNNLNALQSLIYPNRINAQDVDSTLYHTEETFARIASMRQQRTDRLQVGQNLPRIKRAMSLLYTSRVGQADLARITDFLPQDLGQGLERQAIIALAAYKAGLSKAANLSIGGFDTHGNNDQAQTNQGNGLLNGVMRLYDHAEALGMADKMVVVIGSDFGRTPRYNDGNGKDHWSVGSMMMMGPGIPGNRVIGATDDTQRYRKVNPANNEVDDGGGIALKNAHIHKWLRRYAGIEENEIVKLYPIREEEEFTFA